MYVCSCCFDSIFTPGAWCALSRPLLSILLPLNFIVFFLVKINVQHGSFCAATFCFAVGTTGSWYLLWFEAGKGCFLGRFLVHSV